MVSPLPRFWALRFIAAVPFMAGRRYGLPERTASATPAVRMGEGDSKELNPRYVTSQNLRVSDRYRATGTPA